MSHIITTTVTGDARDTATTTSVVIVVGGASLSQVAVDAAPAGAFVIAADSGLDHALAADLSPGLVVGDLDSVSVAGLSWAREHRVPVEEHPPDKNWTDTELALAAAVSRGATDIVLLGGAGDRLDHSIGALTALGSPALAACRTVSAVWGDALVLVLHGPRTATVAMAVDSTFSLLCLHGECTGVRVTGARWPLVDATIAPGSSLGMSNVATTADVDVGVTTGVLTVVVPDMHDHLEVAS